ncbi:MAG: DNA polymerase, partial [Akkermansiaceae bacterium]|nr:DNA polymerase [Akkermansiaceae bacterium]
KMAYSRKLLGQLRSPSFPIGPDGRLRCMLSPFGSDTGRNQPSTANFAFGWPAWLRSLIQAPAGKVLAYVDYSSQEFALAAALAGDPAMADDYASGDPYLAFARRAGATPAGATKDSHPNERATYKVAALAVQYGMAGASLAGAAGLSMPAAERVIRDHREAYPRFWNWRQNIIDHLGTGGTVETRFGWRRKLRRGDRPTSMGNFLVQAAGAEILRLAIIALEETGLRVVAPVHDAVLLELDEEQATAQLEQAGRLMRRAAAVVTGGLEIRTDVELVAAGRNYKDKRGREMWTWVGPALGVEVGMDGFPRIPTHVP